MWKRTAAGPTSIRSLELLFEAPVLEARRPKSLLFLLGDFGGFDTAFAPQHSDQSCKLQKAMLSLARFVSLASLLCRGAVPLTTDGARHPQISSADLPHGFSDVAAVVVHRNLAVLPEGWESGEISKYNVESSSMRRTDVSSQPIRYTMSRRRTAISTPGLPVRGRPIS